MRKKNILLSEYGRALVYLYDLAEETGSVRINLTLFANAMKCDIQEIAEIVDILEKSNYIEVQENRINISEPGKIVSRQLIALNY